VTERPGGLSLGAGQPSIVPARGPVRGGRCLSMSCLPSPLVQGRGAGVTSDRAADGRVSGERRGTGRGVVLGAHS